MREVHERLAARPAAAAACIDTPASLDVEAPFAYAETDFTPEVRASLDALTGWLACHPEATVAVSVINEPHYRNPKMEQDLRAGRLAAVLGALRDAGVADGRVHVVAPVEDPATNPTDSARLTLKGRGW